MVSLLLESIVFGVITGSMLAIATVGFTLQAGVTNVLNFSYGSTMTACAFVAYVCNAAGVSIWIALVVAAAFGAALQFLLNRAVFRPFDRHGTGVHSVIYVTIGLGLLIQYGVEAIWGPNFFVYHAPLATSYHLGPIAISSTQIVILLIAIATMTAVHLILTRTTLGTAMRATAANRQLARSCGIDTDRVVDVAWALSGILCGLAGVVLAINIFAFTFQLGDEFLIIVFAAAVLGGLGQAYGAMLGALVIGVVSQVAAALTRPDFNEIIAFAILVIVLVLRPQGLLGEFVRGKGMVR